jgi:hypothetical protein
MKQDIVITAVSRSDLIAQETAQRSASVNCEVCGALTRSAKPFCLEHIDHMPYAEGVLSVLEQRETEKKRLNAGKTIPVDGFICMETIAYLEQQGSVSLRRLSRDMKLTHDGAEVLANILRRAKIAQITKKPGTRTPKVQLTDD